MAKATVTEYLERARDMSALADRKSGYEKKRLMEIAEAWLKLADVAAKDAQKTVVDSSDIPLQPSKAK